MMKPLIDFCDLCGQERQLTEVDNDLLCNECRYPISSIGFEDRVVSLESLTEKEQEKFLNE